MSVKHWQNYWDSGASTTLAAFGNGLYSGVIGDFWTSVFKQIPDGGRVLEIGAGNAAVSRQLGTLAESHQKPLSILATDQCEYQQPAIKGQYAQLAFRGGFGMEQLPTNLEPVDCIVSNYAIEYSELGKTARGVSAIAKDGALLAAILHCQKSIISQTAREDLKQAGFLLDTGLLHLATELCESVNTGRPRSESDLIKNKLDLTLEKVLAAYAQTSSGVLGMAVSSIKGIFAKGFIEDVRNRLQMAQAYTQNLKQAMERNRDQINALEHYPEPAASLVDMFAIFGWVLVEKKYIEQALDNGTMGIMGEAVLLRRNGKSL